MSPSIVWFDAHGDVHTLQTSTSGYPGGMALQLVMGAHPELLGEALGLSPLTSDRAVLVDARDLDPAEVEVLASGQLAFSSGPVYDPSGKLVSKFSSIWQRDAKGQWKIVFDHGWDVCDCKKPAP